MVDADVRRRTLARKTLPPRYLGGYDPCDDCSTALVTERSYVSGMVGTSRRDGACLAPPRSAELYSAVSRVALPCVGKARRVRPIRRPAECNSAIQQIENLRYGREPAER